MAGQFEIIYWIRCASKRFFCNFFVHLQDGPKSCTFSNHHIDATVEIQLNGFQQNVTGISGSNCCSFYVAVKYSLQISWVLLHWKIETCYGFSWRAYTKIPGSAGLYINDTFTKNNNMQWFVHASVLWDRLLTLPAAQYAQQGLT